MTWLGQDGYGAVRSGEVWYGPYGVKVNHVFL
jgi:hypothetical protein